MGKSYKKNPICKDSGRSKKDKKRIANSVVRMKMKDGVEIGQGNEYKKHYEKWNISDFVFRYTKEEALEYYYKKVDPNSVEYDANYLKWYPTEKEFLRWWRKCYKNK